MNGISIIFQRDFRELRQTNAFRILLLASAAAAIAGSVAISIILNRQPWLGDPSAKPLLNLIISAAAYFLPLFILTSFIWAFSNLAVINEKISGNIESLLATPLSPASIWMAKSLAIFVPGLVISCIAALIIILTVNLAVIEPATGSFVLPAPAMLISFLINPLLFFGLTAFILLFALANNPDIAIAPSFIFGFGLMIGIPLGILTGAIDLASWIFALWYLAGTVVIWAIVIYLTRLLTKENIVLSSKGD